jgi:acetate kinase
MRALVVNAGSSSLKFAVYTGDRPGNLVPLFKGSFERIGLEGTRWQLQNAGSNELLVNREPAGEAGSGTHAGCLAVLVKKLAALQVYVDCAGHRVVHGGDLFNGPVEINAPVLKKLESLSALAPLHQPHNIAGIRALQAVLPGVPQVACFDTAFHRTQPRIQQIYALPHELTEAGIRAYGFHGLSYEYIARQPELATHARVVVAHLGNGASLCAMRDRRSVASSMGFTAVDGLPMGTRTGNLDPGVVLHLLRSGKSADEIENLLYKSSGLLGISGLSSDMRDLMASESPKAAQAIDYFCEKTAQHIARMAVALRGLDAIVFTGGIGENAAQVREDICTRLAFLGVRCSRELNTSEVKERPALRRRISPDASAVAVYVIPTDEERVIAGHAAQLLARAEAA